MNKLDTILYEALEEKDVPSKMLNRQILEKADMEEKKMKKNKKIWQQPRQLLFLLHLREVLQHMPHTDI